MELRFTKMHGLGNDFMVVDAITQDVRLSRQQIQALSDRHRGIGFDQCLILAPTSDPALDFSARFFNADGSEAMQCGNGMRCLGAFIVSHRLSEKQHFKIGTKQSTCLITCAPNHTITVHLSPPLFNPKQIPLAFPRCRRLYTLTHPTLGKLSFHALSLGNPHAVIPTSSLENMPLHEIGTWLNAHPLFPEGVNVGTMQKIHSRLLKLRVFERGVGETEACGSAACAAMICGHKFHKMESDVIVEQPGGSLEISWSGDKAAIIMTGPAVEVYSGTVHLST